MIDTLSEREYEVAAEISKGYSEKEIADRLCVSPKTINNQSYRIKRKLNARSAVDIARIFILSLDNPKKYYTVAPV